MNLVTKNTHKPTSKNNERTLKPNQANPPRAKESANHKLSLFGGYATMYIENSRKPIRVTRAINLNMLSLFSTSYFFLFVNQFVQHIQRFTHVFHVVNMEVFQFQSF